jgi:hypothetical protein
MGQTRPDLVPAQALYLLVRFSSSTKEAPPCDRHDARVAISNTGAGSGLEDASGFAITDPSGWNIARFLCTDLTGDHRPEMIVLLATGRDEAFLFIFRR